MATESYKAIVEMLKRWPREEANKFLLGYDQQSLANGGKRGAKGDSQWQSADAQALAREAGLN